MTIEEYSALPTVERSVVFQLAFVPMDFTPAVLAAVMTGRFGMTLSVAAGIVRDLVSRKIIAVRDERYRVIGLSQLPTCAVARAMTDEADEQGWWPSFDQLKRAVSVAYPNDRSVRASLGPVLRQMNALMDVMRVFVHGGGELRDGSASEIREYGEAFYRGAALHIVSCVSDEPEWPAGVVSKTMVRLMAPYLSLSFLYARPVAGTLSALADSISVSSKTIHDPLVRTYAALCVLIGWREGLEKLSRQPYGETFCEPYLKVLNGKCAEANRLFHSFWEDRFYRDRSYELDNVADRFLAMTVCLVSKPSRRYLESLLDGPGHYGYAWSVARKILEGRYREIVEDFQNAFIRLCDRICSKAVRLEEESGLSVSSSTKPVDALLTGWKWHLTTGGRAAFQKHGEDAFAMASAWGRAGYLNLDGLVLSLFSGAYDYEDEKFRHEAVTSRGVWMLPYSKPEPEWKIFLDSLKTMLARQATAEKRMNAIDGERRRWMTWSICLQRFPDSKDCYTICDICPYLRGESDPEDGTGDQRIDSNTLSSPGVRKWMTDADTSCANMWRAIGGYGYSTTFIATEERLELLCKMTNLEVRDNVDSVYSGDPHDPSFPIRLEQRACEMETVAGEDGSLTLRVPKWLMSNISERFVIRKINDGLYAYVPIPKKIRDLVSLFARYGSDGSVVLPKESISTSGETIDRLMETLPAAAPDESAREKLRSVKASADCVVRLAFSEGVLTLSAAIRPMKDSPDFIVEPGSGAAEKIVSGAEGPYLLVRDLDAERGALARLESVLEDCGKWYDGHAGWGIGDIEKALSALVTLKGLEPEVSLEWIDDRRLRVTSAPKSGVALTSSRTAAEWFGVNGSFTLDDGRVLSVFEMLAAMPSCAGSYVRLSDGDYVHLTRAMTRELAALAAAGHRKGGELEVPRAALPMLDGVFGDGDDQLPLPEEMAKSAAEIRAAFSRRPRVPRALKATLRPYQQDGYRWLSRVAGCGFGMCLADDMGLGKTLQVIALLLERASHGASLVVAPASVCGNWRREIQRFAPTLEPILVHESPDAIGSADANRVLIASYGYLLFHEAEFTGKQWNGVVLDEAQAIKNDASKRAHLVKKFRAQFRVAATGTPVENRLGELWSLFDFLNPGLLGPASSFAQRFTCDGKATPELKRLVKPLVLRRLKADVLDDLPEKTEVTIPVTLGQAERSAYEGCRLHALAAIEAGGGEEQSRISILAELTRLRRFCCHPSLVLGEVSVPSAKMEALVELLGQLHQGGHRALVFSQFVDYLAIVRKVIASHGWTHCYLDGSTPTLERERLVNAFQNGEDDFFLISLKAGGTGLNLTAANYVILLDPWWNPAVENQAADRAHRIGQKLPVTVYRLVAADTVEERVIELHKEKTAMAADLLDGTSNTSFTAADLIRLFR